MSLLKITNLEQYAGERLLFSIDRLDVHPYDRIGLIGTNGSGKTTLLRLLAGEMAPDAGSIQGNRSIAIIEQLVEKKGGTESGGERTKQQIRDALLENPALLLADEPENHLDQNGMRYLIRQLNDFQGALIMISHNRALLNAVCDKIWALDNGEIQVFSGNYDAYFQQNELKKQRAEEQFEQYQKERKRLERSIHQTKQKSASTKKAPSRMGNSEARLHRMGDQRSKKHLDQAAKQMKTRMAQLEKVDKPRKEKELSIVLPDQLQIYAPEVLSATDFSKHFDEKMLFDHASFALKTHSKTALIGKNGSGKTTLLDQIAQRDPQIQFVKNCKIGYFGQFYEQMDLQQSILENVRRVSIHDDATNRNVLASLLFRGDSVFRSCHVLSGGERSRVSLAMLMVSDANVLLLDEVTNHMDLQSVEMVENALKQYDGTILFVSHDEAFVEAIATDIWHIHDGQLEETECAE